MENKIDVAVDTEGNIIATRLSDLPEDLEKKLKAVDSDAISFEEWKRVMTNVVREYNAAYGTNFNYTDTIFTYCLNSDEI